MIPLISSIPGLIVAIAYVDTSTSMSHQSSREIGVFVGRSKGEVEQLVVDHANAPSGSFYGSPNYKDFDAWQADYHWLEWLEAPKPIAPESTDIDGGKHGD